MRKYVKRLTSLALAAAMMFSVTGTAAAAELAELAEQPVAAEDVGQDEGFIVSESQSVSGEEVGQDGQSITTADVGLIENANAEETAGLGEPADQSEVPEDAEPDETPDAAEGEEANPAEDVGADGAPLIGIWSDEPPVVLMEDELSGRPVRAPRAATCPETYNEVYQSMIALKADPQYAEGTTWTNYTPYGRDSDPYQDAYWWQGGKVKGASGGVGCAAFAFILSDTAFGNLPSTTIDNFSFEEVRVGDILRMDGNSHFVIVLEKTPVGVVVAEGNYNKSVHWGRALSVAEVMSADFLVTRYPEGYVPKDAEDAGEVANSGTEGELSWTLTNAGTLTISGSGAMRDFSPNDSDFPSWEEHKAKIKMVIIEDGVTSIGNYAFYQSGVLNASIPAGVARIGQSSFRESALLAVTTPGSVATIENDAFRGCANLISATIADGLTTIGERAFQGCTALQYIDFPASIVSVGAGAFTSCSKMTRVRFMPSDHTVAMGDNLFTQCWNLMSVTLPQGADRISAGMFASCTLLSSLYIPAGVSSIDGQPFVQTALQSGGGISFGGSEAVWNRIGGKLAVISMPNVSLKFDVEFENPFAADPDDPGDLVDPEEPDTPPSEDDPCKDGHTGTADENGNCTVCGKPIGTAPVDPADPVEPEQPVDPADPVEPEQPVDPVPGQHEHDWSLDWTHNTAYHWHECAGEGCTITDNSQKDGYAEHSYGVWVTDRAATASQSGSRHRDCTVCGYRQTGSIPATGGPSSGSGSSGGTGAGSGNFGGSSGSGNHGGNSSSASNTGGSSGGTASAQKSDDSTTVVTDPQTGIKTETTKKPDGSSVVVVTQKDGTVVTTTTDAAGKTETEVKLSAAAINAAGQSNQPVALPITAVQAARNAAALSIAIYTEKDEPVKVAIPVNSPSVGTVAVVVNADGSTDVIKTSVLADNCLVAPLENGAVVKIVDNSKNFSDVLAGTWAEDAIAFVSARELLAGTTAATFDPDSPMTRAMLMVVLARFDGVDTADGAVWYAKGVEWAVTHGISDGADPNSNITREQLVTMIWRYLGAPVVYDTLSEYADASQISSYAQDAMRWAVNNGVVSGFGDGCLGPQEQATRAQVAQILKNLIENAVLSSV